MEFKTTQFVYPPTGVKHGGPVIDLKDGFEVIDCEVCEFRHVVPIPSDEELAKLYGEEFYSHVKPKYFKLMEEDLNWWMLTYNNFYRLLNKYVQGKSILDIGSGPGYFLKCGKDLGWDVLGFEPSKLAWEYSSKLGVKVINDFFTEKSVQQYGQFDVVYMKTVIEHVPDPVSLIRTVKKALKPGGIFCVVSPNDYNPFQNILRDHLGFQPWWVAPPQHLNYFNFSSMQKLLVKLGFRVLDSYGTFPMETFLLSGWNYIGNDEVGRQCQARRKLIEENLYKHEPDRLNSIYNALGRNGLGREFVIIARN